MIGRRLAVLATTVVLSTNGCAFGGLNTLPLPGTVGRGPDASTYHVQLSNVGSLEANSPVLVGDVVVGSVARMRPHDFRADVDAVHGAFREAYRAAPMAQTCGFSWSGPVLPGGSWSRLRMSLKASASTDTYSSGARCSMKAC